MKKAIIILGWSYAVVLSLVYASVMALWVYLRTYTSYDTPSPYAPFVISVFLLIILGVCVALIHVCRRREYARGYRLPVFLILFTIPLLWLMHDAPPIENDYGMKDIVSTDPAVLKSYDTLMLLRKNGDIKVDESILSDFISDIETNDCKTCLHYSNAIYRAWANIAPVRAIIQNLDSYPGIADMTPEVTIGTNTPVVSFLTLRSVCRAYAAYARLQTAEGHALEAVRELAAIHSVTTKALAHASILLDKMIWVAMVNLNIKTAYAILSDNRCTPQAAELLRDAFPPIPKETFSLQKVFIGEYLHAKIICQKVLSPGNFLDALTMTEVVLENGKERVIKRESSIFKRPASCLAYYLTFRENRTCRDIRRFGDLLIAGAGKWPHELSSADTIFQSYGERPDIRNLGGWCMASMFMPCYTGGAKQVTQIKILSDLLAIEIGNRLHQPVVLNDCYTGNHYEYDKQTGLPYSVGPDGKPGTADDITLGKY